MHLIVRFLSKTVANTQAVLSDIVFAPTVVPNEFATSLAPIANARKKAMTNEDTTYPAVLKIRVF